MEFPPLPTFKQARKPRSYASPKLCPPTHLLTDSLTGVKCRATSVAKKTFQNSPKAVIENMFVPEVFQLAKCLFQSFNVNTYNIVRSGQAEFNVFNEGHEDDYS